MADPYYAYCWADGTIGFGEDVPDGVLSFLILKGWQIGLLRDLVQVSARHGHEPDVFLVPGVPEAADEDAADTALFAWVDRCFGDLSSDRIAGAVVVTDEILEEVT